MSFTPISPQTLTRFRPDILISDILLPGEDGYSLLLKIRKLEAERGRQLPAIALSACATEEDRKSALAVGFDRYLSKPADLDELAAATTSLVR